MTDNRTESLRGESLPPRGLPKTSERLPFVTSSSYQCTSREVFGGALGGDFPLGGSWSWCPSLCCPIILWGPEWLHTHVDYLEIPNYTGHLLHRAFWQDFFCNSGAFITCFRWTRQLHTGVVWELIVQLHAHLLHKEVFPNYLCNHLRPHSNLSQISINWMCQQLWRSRGRSRAMSFFCVAWRGLICNTTRRWGYLILFLSVANPWYRGT